GVLSINPGLPSLVRTISPPKVAPFPSTLPKQKPAVCRYNLYDPLTRVPDQGEVRKSFRLRETSSNDERERKYPHVRRRRRAAPRAMERSAHGRGPRSFGSRRGDRAGLPIGGP